MDTNPDNGYMSEDDLNYDEYDSDTNWDNWDLEPNIKVFKSKTKVLKNSFKKICISRIHQPVCKKVKKKQLKVNCCQLSKLLSDLQIKNK